MFIFRLEIGVVPNSRSFSVSKLASCQFHAHFLSRNWRRANFMLIFCLEIGVVPISCSFSVSKLTPCQFRTLILRKKHPTCVRCHNYTVQDIGFLFLFRLLILLVGKFSLLTTFGVMPALIRLYNFGSI